MLMHQYFAVFTTDRPDMQEVRGLHRPAHRRYLRACHPNLAVRIAGPTFDADGAMNGTLLLVEADSRETVERFIGNDPYALSGLHGNIEIRTWHFGLNQLASPLTEDAA